MMSPETAVRILNNTYECGYIQDVSMMGFFTEASCQYFSSVVDAPCGCDSGVQTETPTIANSTIAPSNEEEPATASPESLPPAQVCSPCQTGNVVDVDALVKVPGQSDPVSCGELEKAGMDGSIPVAACATVQDLAATICCGQVEDTSDEDEFAGVCNPCGPDKEMTNLNGIVSIPQQGMLPCNQLAVMGRVLEENEDWCVLIRPFVQTPCGCQSTVPTEAPTSLEPSQPPAFEESSANLEDSGTHGHNVFLAILSMILTTWKVSRYN